jgi:16S rRNA (uracil1498-N3)-methyltransferase
MVRERWLLAPDGWEGASGEITLDEGEARHAVSVLRCRPGDAVQLLDGRGRVGAGRVVRARKGQVEVAVDSVRLEPPVGTGVSIALGVLHTQAMDWAIQKCVEIGMDRLTPIVTERSQGSVEHAARRRAHWREVARQALKQCHRTWVMAVGEPVVMGDLVSSTTGLYGDPAAPPIDAVGHGGGPTTLLIGPEGGLTEAECGQLAVAGWTPVALGPHVLRAETAAVVGGALVAARRWYTPAP